MTVWTEAGSWVAPPTWAVWVPSRARHRISFSGACELRSLYVRPTWARGLPTTCVAVKVSPLLRELIARAMMLGMIDRREPKHRALARLMLDEIVPHTAMPFDLPTPTGAATRAVAERLTQRPELDARTPELAKSVGVSGRTLERQFLAETGVSLGPWRRQVRLLSALRRLGAGESVKQVSTGCGYSEPSAFVAAFKAVFGQTPGRYFTR